jgi:glycosyltransferase involved in cell wall biosynthesis
LKKNKLLIVGAFPGSNMKIFGGIATTCLSLINSSFPTHYELELIDSTQISNPPPSFSVRLILASKRFLRFLSVLFNSKPDAVLIFTSSGTSLMEKGAMAWLARLRRIPVFLFPRGGRLIQSVQESKLQRAWVVPVMRGATHIFCQGPAWQRFAMDILDYPESKAPIIHNWTATESLLTIGYMRSLVLNVDSPSLLFLGWLEEEKGIFELLEACLSLSKTHKFRLIIAGRGHAEVGARAFVHLHGLHDVIEFTGWVAGEA